MREVPVCSLGSLSVPLCMLFILLNFSACDLFAFLLQLICKLTQGVAF